MAKIFLLEDDPAIQMGIRAALEEENYEIVTEDDGAKGFRSIKSVNPDLVILDLLLPGKTGLEVCRELRNDGFMKPIIILTSKKEEVDKIIGLETGADDYMTKPFSVRELIARIRALLRRAGREKESGSLVEFGRVRIDFQKLEAHVNGEQKYLSAKEFQVLKYFIEYEGKVITRDKLLDEVWGYESYPTTRTVDNYILSLRKALEEDPSNPRHLLTIHTVGYKFVR